MPNSTLDTLEQLLESVQDDVDDSDVKYKLRSARQLVGVLQQRKEDFDDEIGEVVADEEVLETLSELGYLD